jgi:hypothetical protein
VIQLVGTPHLFIADELGMLHWGGDTRALAGKVIDWSNHCDVGLDVLRSMSRGDPWLSSGLPKIGNPIYLSKWEDADPSPTLLHIQSISDVELFGINETNYGRFVLERADWEQRYGFSVGSLQLGPLASAASFAWPEADRTAYGQLLSNMKNVLSTALFRANQSGLDAAAQLPELADCERLGLTDFERSRNAGNALGMTQECVNRINLGGPAVGSAPSQPLQVQVTPTGPSLMRISWSDVDDETGYRIYGGDQLAPSTALVSSTPANVTSFDVPNLIPGRTYCYSVAAFNPMGESAKTGPACGSVSSGGVGGQPTAPANLRVSQVQSGLGSTVLRLDWADLSFGETSFQILRGDQPIGSVGPDVITFTDSNWVPGLPTCYRVVALFPAAEAQSVQACLGSPSPGGSPTAPTNLQATLSAGAVGVQLQWTDTSTSEQGFRVFRGDQVIATVGTNSTSYFDPTSWNPNAPVCYRVVAFNDFGEATSQPSCPAGPIGGPAPTSPSPPAGLTVNRMGGASAVNLLWTDTSNNEDGFRLLRNGLTIMTVGPNVTNHVDGQLNLGVVNCYRVVAFNTAGESVSNEACLNP